MFLSPGLEAGSGWDGGVGGEDSVGGHLHHGLQLLGTGEGAARHFRGKNRFFGRIAEKSVFFKGLSFGGKWILAGKKLNFNFFLLKGPKITPT